MPIQLNGPVPILMIFAVPEPLSISTSAPFIECPTTVIMFEKTYSHIATTFYTPASTITNSGHYTCVLRATNDYAIYDGLKNRWKPPFFHNISSVDSYQRLHSSMHASLVIFELQ